MRTLLTTAAMILTLGAATPALADGPMNHPHGDGPSFEQPRGDRPSYERPRGDFGSRGPRVDEQTGFGYDNRDAMDRGHNDGDNLRHDRDFGERQQPWRQSQDDRFGGNGHNDGDSFRHDRDFGEWQQPSHQWQGDRFGGNGQLPRWLLVRRLEAQGYYHVSNLMPGRGYGWRAFAYYHFTPVVLRLDLIVLIRLGVEFYGRGRLSKYLSHAV